MYVNILLFPPPLLQVNDLEEVVTNMVKLEKVVTAEQICEQTMEVSALL